MALILVGDLQRIDFLRVVVYLCTLLASREVGEVVVRIVRELIYPDGIHLNGSKSIAIVKGVLLSLAISYHPAIGIIFETGICALIDGIIRHRRGLIVYRHGCKIRIAVICVFSHGCGAINSLRVGNHLSYVVIGKFPSIIKV